jgi:hypothetical protein
MKIFLESCEKFIEFPTVTGIRVKNPGSEKPQKHIRNHPMLNLRCDLLESHGADLAVEFFHKILFHDVIPAIDLRADL